MRGGSSGDDDGDDGDDGDACFEDGQDGDDFDFFFIFCFVIVVAMVDKNNFNILVRRRTTFGWKGVMTSPMKERRATMVTLKLRSV